MGRMPLAGAAGECRSTRKETGMKRQFLVIQIAALLLLAVCAATAPRAAMAQGVEPDVQAALNALMSKTPAAKNLASQAKGILVFPRVAKAGFIVGAQYGDGQL